MGRFFGVTVASAIEFVRYQAWLSAKPKELEVTRREHYKDTVFVDADPEGYAVWLISLAHEIGLSGQAFSGISPISWGELNAWQESVNFKWPWLLQVIKRMSIEYVNEYYAASDINRPSPLQAHIDLQEQRKVVAQQFHNIFGKRK